MKDETRNSGTRNSAFGSVLPRVSLFAFRVLHSLWRWLRAVLEDDAYDRSREAGGKKREAGVSAAEFYLARLEHKYSRPSRCC
jgi:hypothetical protein